MAWDSKAALASRRRASSRASATSTLTLQQKAGNTAPVQPKSSHVADPFLQDFLQPGFDPAAYWNATLGGGSAGTGAGIGRTKSPTPASTSASGAAGRLAAAASSATATTDRAAQAQAKLSQLGAHTSRLTTVLTQLTDDIIRSGRRLAYEVQLLRGETLGLGEVLEKHLALLEENETVAAAKSGDPKGAKADSTGAEASKDGEPGAQSDPTAATAATPPASEPPSLTQLRMLAQVRSRLDAVIRIFGEAMEFVMPPSAISVTASFLSVSGPDQESGGGPGGSGGGAGGQHDAASTTSMEEKGQKVLRTLRDEVARLLEGANTENDGAEAAAIRVETLRVLCRVWAGTAEEKARVRFVESLQKMVEDRQKELDRERERLERQQRDKLEREANNSSAASGASGVSPQPDGSAASNAGASKGYAAAGYGFISQLHKIRL
ncbi:hypothetical protein SEUCBS139899_001573 [Sporothrix eucalyptigena]|uniref:Uncharacterized protein n=1 Tax=Sporothrix eucalyptigena TaxID=1812306 RepID=A0ABP0BN71_9PEZI